MPQTVLYPWLSSSAETRMGVYNGVETALSFGNPVAELAALGRVTRARVPTSSFSR